MRLTLRLVVGLFILLAGETLAQESPPVLELPVGARVRLRTHASPGEWIEGVLAGADTGTISLVPQETPPLGANQLRIPSGAVTQLELVTGKKTQWFRGLLIGTALGAAIGFSYDVDPAGCDFDEELYCSRGSAVAANAATGAALGLLVGGLIKRDVWTPVALDTLGPPRDRSARTNVAFHPVPGGLALGLSVRF